MKSKKIIYISAILLILTSCDNLLDRPSLTATDRDNFWRNENDLELYCKEYYSHYFIGYGNTYGGNYISQIPMIGFLFNDDLVINGYQTDFEVTIPSSRGGTGRAGDFISSYTGTNWNFAWVRKTNIMIEALNNQMDFLSADKKNHWLGMARFFRGIEYASLVRVFGDVPFFNKEVAYDDLAENYKPRTPRNDVMDSVYNDLKFAFSNIEVGNYARKQLVNRYLVAAYICRLMLCEGTWQKYYYNNTQRAQKFFEFAIEAGNYVINSGYYSINKDYRALFGGGDLKTDNECIMYRVYNASATPTALLHTVATYCNLRQSQSACANLNFLKAFLCQDGEPYQSSTLANADKFDLENLMKTRDPRFEAIFWDKLRIVNLNRTAIDYALSSGIYICKFISREGSDLGGNTSGEIPLKYSGASNDNDAPVMRYAEVLLNWIEAKAELATIGGPMVTQAEIDASINAIRKRPIAPEATAKGILPMAQMSLASLPDDPARDQTVPALIWEIRRERRIEMFGEYARLVDLRRWKKLEYMDDTQNPDLLKGLWINFPADLPTAITAARVDVMGVVNASGDKIIYDGTNASAMVGYYSPITVRPRLRQFLNVTGVNPYLAPVGINQIADYANRGYELKQTEGWGN